MGKTRVENVWAWCDPNVNDELFDAWPLEDEDVRRWRKASYALLRVIDVSERRFHCDECRRHDNHADDIVSVTYEFVRWATPEEIESLPVIL